MDGGAWQATVHGVAKSWTPMSDFISLKYLRRKLIMLNLQRQLKILRELKYYKC